ncbi:prolipoprotein diacylglyceryl transferase [Chloroflexota bacterium]
MIEIGISPIAFSVGPVDVAWYGIMVALAVLTLLFWTYWQIRSGRAKISIDTFTNAALVGIPSGIVGARLFHVVDYWDYYAQNPGLIIGGSGLAIYGAVLGAALGLLIYSRFSRISFGYFADVLSPGIILAQAIGRVGCLFNGCCYGEATDIFCAIVYTNPETLGPLGIPVHPTQVYEIIYNLAVFGLLFWLRGRFKPAGSLFAIYLALYSVWRIGLAFLREGTPFFLGLNQAQVISAVILIICGVFIALKTRPVKREND